MCGIRNIAVVLTTICVALAVLAGESASDSSLDVSSIMSRGFNINDEPSLLESCGENYSAFRIFEHGAGRPIAVVRAESTIRGNTILFRSFDSGILAKDELREIPSDGWRKLMQVITTSGFWNMKSDETVWMPDSRSWWAEGCLDTKYHYVQVYPDVDLRLQEVVDYLVTWRP